MSETFTTLFSFNGTAGSYLYSGLTADAAGDLFGTTAEGGTYGDGTVFEITNTGTLTTLVSFSGGTDSGYTVDGGYPVAGLITDTNGDLFGTTTFGGGSGDGTVFEIANTTTGYATTATTLVSFNGNTGGSYPTSSLIADASGDLFGTTVDSASGGGTVFEIANTGTGYASTPVTLVSFSGGEAPYAGLITDTNGDLFGTTTFGGSDGVGSVFEIAKTTTGYASSATTLVSFTGGIPVSSTGGIDGTPIVNLPADGSIPTAGLIVDARDDLFGTTTFGGSDGDGAVFEIANTGTGYASTATTLVSFTGGTDGGNPTASLIIDAAGDLFGTTSYGGSGGDGTVFEIANTGTGYADTPTTLFSFNGGADGGSPYAGLIADAAGNLFGTTLESSGGGTVFELTDTGYTQPCYCRGTHIATDRGEVLVEDLRIGDGLLTASGVVRPIRWIGRRSYGGRFLVNNLDVLPVRIRQGALADGVPHRDLLVSPGHAMFLDGMLIPARGLLNGVSVIRAEAVEAVEYFHLELDSHDVIQAEGALSETFIDDDSRNKFQNAAEYRLLYPDAVRSPPRYCAPRVEDGAELEAVRLRIIARTRDKEVAAMPPGPLHGGLDVVRRDRISGWALDTASPDVPVALRILDNGVVIGQALADRYRADLEAVGIGDGRHGFTLDVPSGLSPLERHVIEVQRATDRSGLHGSPWILEAAATPEACLAAAPVATPAAAPTALPVHDDAPVRAPASWRGSVDIVTRDLIAGWACDTVHPDEPVALQILDNGVPVAWVLANSYRSDLQTTGIGDGRHGFEVRIPGGLSPLARHVIHVRREADGGDLPNSPATIEAATRFDTELEQAVANAVTALDGSGEYERVLSFLAAQTDRLLQQHADSEGRRESRLTDARFRRRWGPATETAGPGLRALVVDESTPAADRDGGSQAILSHMRALQRLGYTVSFVAAEQTGIDAALEAEGITHCRAPFYASVEEVLRRQAGCFDVIYLHRGSSAAKYLAIARQSCPRARILYSVADLNHVRLARQAAAEDRPELLVQSRQMRLTEGMAAQSADAVLTHSAAEAVWLRQMVPGANVHIVPRAVPARPVTVPFAARRGIAFIGDYEHAWNADAARILAEDIMPRVWQADPATDCLLVGSHMPDAVRKLARPGLLVVGEADLAEIFDRVRLTVAPLRYGAGVKDEVLTSFAAGVPCIMSPIAAEAIDLPGLLAALVGPSAAELAALIVRLHTDSAVCHASAEAGLALIDSGFGEAQVVAALGAAIGGRRQPERHEAARAEIRAAG